MNTVVRNGSPLLSDSFAILTFFNMYDLGRGSKISPSCVCVGRSRMHFTVTSRMCFLKGSSASAASLKKKMPPRILASIHSFFLPHSCLL